MAGKQKSDAGKQGKWMSAATVMEELLVSRSTAHQIMNRAAAKGAAMFVLGRVKRIERASFEAFLARADVTIAKEEGHDRGRGTLMRTKAQ